jgi:hypothetical protein
MAAAIGEPFEHAETLTSRHPNPFSMLTARLRQTHTEGSPDHAHSRSERSAAVGSGHSPGDSPQACFFGRWHIPRSSSPAGCSAAGVAVAIARSDGLANDRRQRTRVKCRAVG